MTIPLRVIIVEDSADDALLLERELKKGGYTPYCLRVDNGEDLKSALNNQSWDLVITDHSLPNFDSYSALEIVKESGFDLPVIIVSGTIGEDIAVDAMRAGAQDYVMKDNIMRLLPAIERELREAQNRLSNRRAKETITRLASQDLLTGLANRNEFERSAQLLIRSASNQNTHALIYLDLDQFKIINDTSGHEAGDELLRTLSVLLTEPIRNNDVLARLGGDEFGVLLNQCSIDKSKEVAERLLKIVQDFHFTWENKSFSLSASIGLVMIDNLNVNLSELLQAADMACYAAKSKGGNYVYIYQHDDAELLQFHGEMEWVARLNNALKEERFELYQQSIIALDDNQGDQSLSEFLLRMRDEDGNLILPGVFIPAAERYNLIPAIDRWVFSHVCKILALRNINYKSINFINISGATLDSGGFFDFVREQLELNKLPPQIICFEVTETAAITHFTAASAFFKKVRNLGAHIALDDFGAGLSSFSYLKNIPADYLKIDGGFVRSMLANHMDFSIVNVVNNLGHMAGLKTIAEFVETDAIKEALNNIGVDYAQGYVIEKPHPSTY